MGADFCCAIFPVPKKKGTRHRIELNFDAAEKAIETTDWQMTELCETRYSIDEENAVIRADLRDALERFKAIHNRELPRDCAWFERPKEWLLVSGGMTWGDSPTDTFEVLDILDVSGLADVLIQP